MALGVSLAVGLVGCRGPGVEPELRPAVGDLSFAYGPGGDTLLVSFSTETSSDQLFLVSIPTYERVSLGLPGAFPSWRAGAPSVLVMVGASIARVDLSGPSIAALPVPGLTIYPAWHPTAPIFAVTTNMGDGGNPPDLWLGDSVGGGLRRIPLSGPPRNQTNAASWAPDGHHLVASEVGRLLVFDSTGADTAYLTPTSMVAEFPQWSPDGQWILFQRVTNSGPTGADLYLVRPNGSDLHRLTANGRLPRWRPDGNRIGFVRTQDGVYAVWSILPAGTDLRQETFPPIAP